MVNSGHGHHTSGCMMAQGPGELLDDPSFRTSDEPKCWRNDPAGQHKPASSIAIHGVTLLHGLNTFLVEHDSGRVVYADHCS